MVLNNLDFQINLLLNSHKHNQQTRTSKKPTWQLDLPWHKIGFHAIFHLVNETKYWLLTVFLNNPFC